MTKFEQYEKTLSLTWYAVDLDRHVGAFMLGEIPSAARAFEVHWERIDQMLSELPESSEYQLLIKKEDYWAEARYPNLSAEVRQGISDRMFPRLEKNLSVLPRRGIYQFKGEEKPFGVMPLKYNRVCIPVTPICVECLPDDARNIIASICAPVRFSEIGKLDYIRIVPCTETSP